jgi:CelD/BcsL family acetyltransferase involved in cellulose biosynthesis
MALEHGFRQFDFALGRGRDAADWAATASALCDHVSPATLRGWPVALFIRSSRLLGRKARHNPVLRLTVGGLRIGPRRSRRPDDGSAPEHLPTGDSPSITPG